MKVLLLGDYSSLHHNLSYGLRELGVNVTVASNGDFWKDIPRDIDLKQPDKYKRIKFPIKLLKNYPKLIGFDVVQLIAPNFLMSTPRFSSLYFELIKRGNDKIFMCASGMDYIYINYALTRKLKYSVFYHKDSLKDPFVKGLYSLKDNIGLKNLDYKVASYCKGIIATSNGYYYANKDVFPDKTHYIPLPINTNDYPNINSITPNTKKVKFFLGLMKNRVALKGTDRIKDVLTLLKKKYPNDVDLTFVDSVPYKEYIKLLNNSHVLCDQLYAYGTGMNGLISMSKGLIVAGSADNEMYEMLNEYENRPILDLNTTNKEMLQIFENLIENKHKLYEHSLKSREFVVKHHDSIKIAQQYLNIWKSK